MEDEEKRLEEEKEEAERKLVEEARKHEEAAKEHLRRVSRIQRTMKRLQRQNDNFLGEMYLFRKERKSQSNLGSQAIRAVNAVGNST